jgi:hypothetical protein
MGHRYGLSDVNEILIGTSIWDMGYPHIDMVIQDIDTGIWANDMGDDSIDTVILHIDMGYLVTLCQILLAAS